MMRKLLAAVELADGRPSGKHSLFSRQKQFPSTEYKTDAAAVHSQIGWPSSYFSSTML